MVPRPSDPQSFNRFAAFRGNPLIHTDPTGHDLMLVHGYCQECNDDYIKAAQAWANWIRAYKGWDESFFSKFITDHSNPSSLEAALRNEGVRIFQYANRNQSAPISSQDVEDLSSQMVGMKDITLVGHSKGANLVMNYISAKGASEVEKFVIDKAPMPGSIPFGVSGSRAPGSPFAFNRTCTPLGSCPIVSAAMTDFGGNVVNIYSSGDFFGDMHQLSGAINETNSHSMMWRSWLETYHGRGSVGDAQRALSVLLVYGNDQNAATSTGGD